MAETIDYSPHDWPEDFSHENGNYQCKCCHCGKIFIGHKRRLICRFCQTVSLESSIMLVIDGKLYYEGDLVDGAKAEEAAKKYGFENAEQLIKALNAR